MLDIYRRDRGALVALGLILAAIVCIALLLQIGAAEPRAEPVPQGSATEQYQDGDDQTAPVVSSEREFWFFGDSPAQWIMAAFSAIATGVSIWAVKRVGDTWRESKLTARAAVKANAIARRASRAELRAYVLPVEARLMDTETANPRLVISMKNTGQTPAYDVRWAREVAVRVGEDGLSVDGLEYRKQPTMGPGEPIHRTRVFGMFQWVDHAQDLQANANARFYTYGRITYRDAFDQPHFTDFRLVFTADHQSNALRDGDFSFCEEGNDSD